MTSPGDFEKIAQLYVANFMGYQCEMDSLYALPTKDTAECMKRTLHYWSQFLKELIPHMPKDARKPFEGLRAELKKAISTPVHLIHSRSATRKLKQEGGKPGNLVVRGFGKQGPPPVKNGLALTLRKAGSKVASKVSETLDIGRLDEYTRNRVKHLTTLANRLVIRGEHGQAAMVQATIDSIRDQSMFLPQIPMPLILAILTFCIYMTPTWIRSTFTSAISIAIGVPLATAGGAVSGVGQGALNVAKGWAGYNTTTNATDAAIAAAQLLGGGVVGSTRVVFDAAVPDEARQLGYLVGAMFFIPFIATQLGKYNKYILGERMEYRKKHTEMMADLEKTMREKLPSKAASGVPLLLGDKLSNEDQTQIDRKIKEIYSHFKITKEEQALPVKKLVALLKKRYRERLLGDHPNKGGKSEVFQKTKELYKAALDILVLQGEAVNANDENNAEPPASPKGQASPKPPAPANDAGLPAGWMKHYDEGPEKRIFYYCEARRTSQYERPTEPCAAVPVELHERERAELGGGRRR
jgi:hypothetical protein